MILVNVNPAYRTSELEYVAQPVRLPAARRGAGVQDARLRRDGRGGAAALPAARAGRVPRHARLGPAARRRRRRRRTTSCASAAPRCSSTTRSTSSTRAARPASPRARRSAHHNILNNGYFVGEACGYTRGRPRLHPGALLPLLRHGDGQPRRAPRTAPAWSIPAPAFEPAATLEAVEEERCTSLYGVPTMFIAELDHPDFDGFDLSSLRTGDHGRLAVPGRGHAQGASSACTCAR